MQLPIDITFRGMTPSASVEGAIRRWTDRIERTYGRVQRCSVVVEQPHLHRTHGNRFRVRVELVAPGGAIEVSHDSAIDSDHENVYVAVADAFRAARRQLQDRVRIARGDVKTHEPDRAEP